LSHNVGVVSHPPSPSRTAEADAPTTPDAGQSALAIVAARRQVAYVNIDNPNDTLSQVAWSKVVAEIHAAVRGLTAIGGHLLFAGTTTGASPLQAAAWAVILPDAAVAIEGFRYNLAQIAVSNGLPTLLFHIGRPHPIKLENPWTS
jgi:hypothetical protein